MVLRFLALFTLAAALQPGVSHATFGKSEVYVLKSQVSGEEVTQTVQVFNESPLDDPNLIQDINESNIQDVMMMHEGPNGIGRDPSDVDEEEQIRAKVLAGSKKPVDDIEVKPGFLKMVEENFKAAFPKLDRTNSKQVQVRKERTHYSVVSTSIKTSFYTTMVIGKHYPLDIMIPMILMQGFWGYIQGTYAKNLGTLFERSYVKVGKSSHFLVALARRMAVQAIINFQYKLAELRMGVFTPSALLAVGTNTLLTAGDALVLHTLQKKFRLPNGEPDEGKINRTRFWIAAIDGGAIQLDLLNFYWNQFAIGPVELRWTEVFIIAWFGGLLAGATYFPEKMHNGLVKWEKFLGKIRNRIKRPITQWIDNLADCDAIYRGEWTPLKPPIETPTQESLH